MKRTLLYILLFCSAIAYAQTPAKNAAVRVTAPTSGIIGDVIDGLLSYTASGTDTYTITTDAAYRPYAGSLTYADGDLWTVTFTNANTSSTLSLNIDSEGAVALKDNEGNDLAVGAIPAGGTFKVRHNGTQFRIIGASGSGITREIDRAFSEQIDFNRNEIYFAPTELSGDLNFVIGDDNLTGQSSAARVRIITNGTHAINFGEGFDFIYGIQNGQVPVGGTYEIYFIYLNGSVTVSFPGVSSESSTTTQLTAPSNFTATADGETEIDLSWTDVDNESSYLIEFSTTGTGGWSTLSTPAANATTSNQTGLSSGVTRYYRIKAIGDGVTFTDSPYSEASATTENAGDVTAPEFTFSPVNGNSTWTVNQSIIITANEAIRNTDGSEITNANVASRLTLKETNSGGSNISFSATIDATKTIITISPTTSYGQSQVVYVAINNVEDINGNEVTVAESITFTTTEYTLFNGSSNRIIFGDILDALFANADTNFELECKIQNYPLSGYHMYVIKGAAGGDPSSSSFLWYQRHDDIVFIYVMSNGGSRAIEWNDVLDGDPHTLTLKYDGSLDTNNGLDRVILEFDGTPQGGGTVVSPLGVLGSSLKNVANQLSFGIQVNSSGTPLSSSWYSGEIKDIIIRSNSGATTELNIPNVKTGVDTSGNGRNGTFN